MNITQSLIHTAVYWGNPQSNGYGGYFYDDPVEISVRWNDEQRKYLGKTKGLTTYTELISNAAIMVDQDLDLGGMIAQTTLNDLTSAEDPGDNNAFEIKAIEKTASTSGDVYFREVLV
jgi:hypothetical protein